jgi:hypothetical protein
MAGIGVEREYFRGLSGSAHIKTYEASLLESPPPYRACFCEVCGCPVPDADGTSNLLEIPAGLLDDDPDLHPDKHIFVEQRSSWFQITDELPQLDKETLVRHRRDSSPP